MEYVFHYHTCIGPGMQDKTLSMFSEFTSTSFTATRVSPGDKTDKRMRKLDDITQQYKAKQCFVLKINLAFKQS